MANLFFRRTIPVGSVVKNPPANAEDMASIPDLGRSHMLRSNLAPCTTTEPVLWSLRAALLKPTSLEPVFCNKRKPAHCKEEKFPLAATREKPM